MTSAISADFPFESKFVDILGSRMHYIEEGSGDPILFLHGNPTSSYVWRNIIPHLSAHGRCIAPDLIGMGKSDKPALAYRFEDHAKYLDGFIEKLELRNITLVLHDWGSGLGFHYFARHEDNVKALVFMEAILRPMSWDEFPIGPRIGFKLFRAPGLGWLMLSVFNMFGCIDNLAHIKGSDGTVRMHNHAVPSQPERHPGLQGTGRYRAWLESGTSNSGSGCAGRRRWRRSCSMSNRLRRSSRSPRPMNGRTR